MACNILLFRRHVRCSHPSGTTRSPARISGLGCSPLCLVLRKSAPIRLHQWSGMLLRAACRHRQTLLRRPDTHIRSAARLWTQAVSHSENAVQSYISSSDDPYLNLCIENFLLKRSPPHAVVLLLYTNRPCVIIGRNQNPWLEVNLGLLNAATASHMPETEPPGLGTVDLVRRRSGGGTVFHDEGNVNWTVISPSADFTRDKHVEMVVAALRRCGVERARVNERHDIVLDQGATWKQSNPNDFHRTPFTDADALASRPVKVSGSAYKLTRTRSLHHATCLLSSPNLNIIPDYLHSPARPYIKAKGVESVSSPVGNIGLSNEEFQSAVQTAFTQAYGQEGQKPLQHQVVGLDALNDAEIKADWDELQVCLLDDNGLSNHLPSQTADWIFGQTPQFTFSTHPIDGDKRPRPADTKGLPSSAQVFIDSRHGLITDSAISLPASRDRTSAEAEMRLKDIKGVNLYKNEGWRSILSAERIGSGSRGEVERLADWLEMMLATRI